MTHTKKLEIDNEKLRSDMNKINDHLGDLIILLNLLRFNTGTYINTGELMTKVAKAKNISCGWSKQ